MNYKVEGAIKKNRKPFIISVILWVIITIVFIVPLSYSVYAATYKGGFNGELFMKMFGNAIQRPFSVIGKIIEKGAIGEFFKIEIGFTLFYSIFFFIGFVKSAPKHEYSDIEHGSSDWSKNGELYQILNKNKGIILAENNYLPVDKRGNVNVLVVGRFWFW